MHYIYLRSKECVYAVWQAVFNLDLEELGFFFMATGSSMIDE